MKTKMPIIKLRDVMLRDINVYDYLDYYDIGKDEKCVKYLSWGPFRKKVEALWMIEKIFLNRPSEKLPVGYAIVDNESQRMIGTIDFHTYYSNINASEIGFCLHKEYWNKGIITKCLKQMILLGFEHLLLNKIIIGHVRDNVACMHVIEKCGFKYQKTLVDNFYIAEEDKFADVLYYELDLKDFRMGEYYDNY